MKKYADLKEDAHPCYELARSLNLVGPLPSSSKPTDHPPPLPVGLRVRIFALRWLASLFSALYGAIYVMMLCIFGGVWSYWDSLLPNQPFVFRALIAISLMTPYSIVSVLVARDMLRSESPLIVAIAITIGCAIVVCIPLSLPAENEYARQGSLLVVGSVCVYWIVHALAAKASTVLCVRERERSRVALLYDKLLGLTGSHFVQKVVCLQLFTTVTQTWAKLPQMGRLVWMQDAAGSTFQLLDKFNPFFFGDFMVGLFK